MKLHQAFLLACSASVLITMACGDGSSGEDGETGNGTADGSETANSESGQAEGGTGSGSGDGDGDGDGDETPGDGDGASGDGDGDGGPGDGDGDGGPGDGDGDGDGDPIACVDHETQADCEADVACQVVTGRPLGDNGPAPCVEDSEYLGCIDMMICDDALTWFCIDGQPYLVPNGCGPEGADMCDPGVQDPGDCP